MLNLYIYVYVCEYYMLNVHFQNTIVISRNLYYYYHYRNYISIHGCCGS